MLKKAAAALLVAASLPAAAQPPAAATASGPPRLIIAISVDQFSADLFSQYRPYYSGGLKRLSNGAVFPRAYQSHAATETCPGHSTILTGGRPARTGIIANSWFDLGTARADKEIYCAEDESEPGSSSEDYVASPVHLRIPTLGDRMKAVRPATRVVSIAGKDRAAIMMGGHRADQVWWLGPEGYVSYRGIATPPLVAKVNELFASRLAQANPGFGLPPQCASKDFPVSIGGGRTVGTGRFIRDAGSYKSFRVSPEQDALTLAFAAAAVDEMQLGQGPQTDLLAIGLSATDTVGHAYGTEGAESCIQIDRLDRELGAFFDRLDARNIDYLVMLTADHGGHDLPERHRLNAMPMEQRVDPALRPAALSAAISARTGMTGDRLIRGDGPAGDLYFDRSLTVTQRAKVEAATLSFLRSHSQVEAAFTKAQIAAQPSPSGPPESWSLLQKARASFDVQRSGDLLVVLKPRITSIAQPSTSVATHGTPWDTDRQVPILFWRKGMRSFEQPLGIETVDIMPTLAALIGLSVPAQEIDGRCLDLIAGDGDSCPAAP